MLQDVYQVEQNQMSSINRNPTACRSSKKKNINLHQDAVLTTSGQRHDPISESPGAWCWFANLKP